MVLGKSRLINQISSLNGFPKRNAGHLLESLLKLIKSTLESGEPIMISGFGKFQVKDKQNRRGRNPQTGNLILDIEGGHLQMPYVLKERINKMSNFGNPDGSFDK